MPHANADTDSDALCHALTRVVAEHGWVGASAERIARAAGLPAHALYDHFRSPEHCLAAVYDRMMERVTRTAVRAVAGRPLAVGPDAWRIQLETVLGAVLTFFSLEPALARTCLVEVVEAGPVARARRDDALARFTAYVEGLRLSHGEPIPRLAAEVIALGTTDIIARRVVRGETDKLRDLLPDLRCMWDESVREHAPAATVVAD
ncbi:MAG: helix-turn-helix domain-containing protein [Thermoleophilaceae bacterium]